MLLPENSGPLQFARLHDVSLHKENNP